MVLRDLMLVFGYLALIFAYASRKRFVWKRSSRPPANLATGESRCGLFRLNDDGRRASQPRESPGKVIERCGSNHRTDCDGKRVHGNSRSVYGFSKATQCRTAGLPSFAKRTPSAEHARVWVVSILILGAVSFLRCPKMVQRQLPNLKTPEPLKYCHEPRAGAGGLRSVVAATAQPAGTARKSGRNNCEAKLFSGGCYDGA